MKIFRKLFGRRATPLTADSPDETYVEVVGIARALEGEETIVPPVSGVVCVVARVRYEIPMTGSQNAVTKIERFHNRPFALETDGLDVVVESPFLELDVVRRKGVGAEEESVPEGARIRVRGIVMREIARPEGDTAFRETQYSYRISGTEDIPVEITASVSDDDRS